MTPPDSFPTLETERLLLREIIETDAPAVFATHGDAELMRLFGSDPLTDLAGAEALIRTFASERKLPSPGTRWAIEIKGTAGLVGTCALFGWHRGWRKCIVGYELAKGGSRKGLYARGAGSGAVVGLQRDGAQSG